jgi:hypothetical protein
VWLWDSTAYADETTATGKADYAHINSVQEVGDGDVIASFRHFSSVFRIATRAHDGYQPGDVIWKLGGRDSSFDFVDDPYGGPCAQHTAYELPNGHVLLFDNGTNGLCVDQSDPTGPTINRGQSRVAEYQLDTTNRTATLVWSYEPPNHNAFFAGSAQRLGNGNTLVGWAAATQAVATEVSADRTPVWELEAVPDPDGKRYFTYRAAALTLDDVVRPEVSVSSPADGASFALDAAATVDYTCTDRGGSALVDCTGDAVQGQPLDTATAGEHTFTVTAHDAAGNQTQVQRHYTVIAPVPPTPPATYRPDAVVRPPSSARWVGANVYSGTQEARAGIARRGRTVTGWWSLQNDGNRNDTLTVKGVGSSRYFRVRYFVGTREVTGAVVAGTLRTSLAPGRSLALRAVVKRTWRAAPGRSRTFAVSATSLGDRRADRASLLVSATRR